jgi:hypothetical protein
LPLGLSHIQRLCNTEEGFSGDLEGDAGE